MLITSICLLGSGFLVNHEYTCTLPADTSIQRVVESPVTEVIDNPFEYERAYMIHSLRADVNAEPSIDMWDDVRSSAYRVVDTRPTTPTTKRIVKADVCEWSAPGGESRPSRL